MGVSETPSLIRPPAPPSPPYSRAAPPAPAPRPACPLEWVRLGGLQGFLFWLLEPSPAGLWAVCKDVSKRRPHCGRPAPSPAAEEAGAPRLPGSACPALAAGTPRMLRGVAPGGYLPFPGHVLPAYGPFPQLTCGLSLQTFSRLFFFFLERNIVWPPDHPA